MANGKPNLKRSLIFTSIVSYQGKIFLGSEMKGTYVIDHNSDDFTPRPYKFEDEICPISARYMDTGYGMLLVANGYQVALHDGKKWRSLYNNPDRQDEEDLLVMSHITDKLEQLTENLSDASDGLKK